MTIVFLGFRVVFYPLERSVKHLSFSSLRYGLSLLFGELVDERQVKRVDHTMHDVVMSGFAMMYFQDPSLLQFQERLRNAEGRDNLQTLFGVETIPKDTQMRNILDELDREQFRPAFKDFFHRLQRGKHLEQYRLMDGSYLCSIDGSEYFGSESVHCKACLEKKSRGKIRYSHQILQGAIMHPEKRQIIPMMPEEIRNSDGTEKQDCEINAGKRFISKLRVDHPKMQFTIAGDGLTSTQPMIEHIRRAQMNFILVAKPGDHKILMEWVGEQKQLGEVKAKRVTDVKGRTHVYEWVNQVPLNGNMETVEVNYFFYRLIDTKNGERKVTLKYSWVTDFEVNSKNVEELARAGRCRWKIENECFNALKNQGYHIEHNYGHGKKNLSFNFLILTLLAFFSHQIAELTDGIYQQCREKLGSKRHLWETVRSAIKWFVFETMEMLFSFILKPKNFLPHLSRPG